MNDRLLENEKHPKWKKFLYATAFICLMMAGFLMVFSMRSKKADAPKPASSAVWEISAFEDNL